MTQIDIEKERTKAILQKRASQILKSITKEELKDTEEFVLFHLSKEIYGIESKYITEIFPLKDLVSIPCTPNFIKGIINVRGNLLSVIDIKKFFNLDDTAITELNKVLILKRSNIAFGILADSIIGVRGIDTVNLVKSLPTLKGISEEYLKGITIERYILLDAQKIIQDPKLIINEEI